MEWNKKYFACLLGESRGIHWYSNYKVNGEIGKSLLDWSDSYPVQFDNLPRSGWSISGGTRRSGGHFSSGTEHIKIKSPEDHIVEINVSDLLNLLTTTHDLIDGVIIGPELFWKTYGAQSGKIMCVESDEFKKDYEKFNLTQNAEANGSTKTYKDIEAGDVFMYDGNEITFWNAGTYAFCDYRGLVFSGKTYLFKRGVKDYTLSAADIKKMPFLRKDPEHDASGIVSRLYMTKKEFDRVELRLLPVPYDVSEPAKSQFIISTKHNVFADVTIEAFNKRPDMYMTTYAGVDWQNTYHYNRDFDLEWECGALEYVLDGKVLLTQTKRYF